MTRVDSLEEVFRELKSQGARLGSVKDLRPSLIGRAGYVGCLVDFADGETQRVWVRVELLASWASRASADRAEVAEWLTHELVEAGGELEVDDLISRFVRRYSSSSSRLQPFEPLSWLSLMADRMGFVADPLAQSMRLPDDHPLWEEAGWRRGLRRLP